MMYNMVAHTVPSIILTYIRMLEAFYREKGFALIFDNSPVLWT